MIQQHKAVEAHQRLMAQRNDSSMASSSPVLMFLGVVVLFLKYAGVTDVNLAVQTRPVQPYPRQVPANMQMQSQSIPQQRYPAGYVISNHGSQVNSMAPSARNSPPLQPVNTRHPVPGFVQPEPLPQYIGVDAYGRQVWSNPVAPARPHTQPQPVRVYQI